jgi:hypothetical protein
MNSNLNADYWDNRYQKEETGWDLKSVSPPLKSYIDTLTDKNIKILIPGCGNAYEAEYLLSKGFNNITLIDIAASLVNKLQQKYIGKSIRIILNDFFEHDEKYDLILEQTFFCAIDPSLRKRYAEKCVSLLNEGGKIAGLLFDTTFENPGPPFGGLKEEYQHLFEPFFILKQFNTCTNSIAPRQGRELFVEMEKKIMNK